MDEHERAPDSAELARIEFLDAEIDLCHTFLNVAETEAREPEMAARATRRARQGYEKASALLVTVRHLRELDRLTIKLYSLRERMEAFVT
jgi:hypothetical protein